MYKIIPCLCLIMMPFLLSAQNDEIIKHENLVYYNSSIKEYLQYMRENTEDAQMLAMIDSMAKYNMALEEKLNSVVLPEVEEEPAEIAMENEESEEITEEYPAPEYESEEQGEEDFESFGMDKFMPFKRKFKTSFEIQVGINNLNIKSVAAGVNEPEVYTPASWYWDFALLTKNRLGGKNSKVALSYGFSYLINRFSMDNDVRLTIINDKPEFVEVSGAKNNPKLNIGYLTVPVAFDFKLSKGFQFSLGGFAGYRVHTVQKLETKPDYERIEEVRFANYRLNNWLYGAKVSIGLRGFNLVGRYCFNNLFRENNNYDVNTFMIGTSFRM